MEEDFELTPALKHFTEVLHPTEADEPILSEPVRVAVRGWLTEIWATEELKAVNLTPRRTAILYGPPGCGKTTLAHHFSARLGLPLVCLKMDSLVDSHVGGTGNRIARIFEDLTGQEGKFVLFLDEFDAVATKRTSDNQAAAREMNATVNSLLKRIEGFEGTAIAATNRADAIDPAMWRRFGLHLDVALPGIDERFAILRRYLDPYVLNDEDNEILARACKGAPPSLLRQVMEAVKRTLVLNPKLGIKTDIETVFKSILASTQPHQSYEAPPLWSDANTQEKVFGIEWPPKKTSNEKAAA